MSEQKFMPISEFRELGFLQEINRTFLHPAGMAFAIEIDDNGVYSIAGVIDCRDNPEGLMYQEIDQAKKEAYQRLITEKFAERSKKLGGLIQHESLKD